MKIRIDLKDPDGVYESISEYVQKNPKASHEDVEGELSPWIDYGEYLSVEIDTETGETKVLKKP